MISVQCFTEINFFNNFFFFFKPSKNILKQTSTYLKCFKLSHTHLTKVAKQCSNSKKRQIKHKNSYKIFTISRTELSNRPIVKRQPVRNNPEDGSAKLSWFSAVVEAKERHRKRTSTRTRTGTRSLLRLVPTERPQQLHQQVCGVPARRLLVQ